MCSWVQEAASHTTHAWCCCPHTPTCTLCLRDVHDIRCTYRNTHSLSAALHVLCVQGGTMQPGSMEQGGEDDDCPSRDSSRPHRSRRRRSSVTGASRRRSSSASSPAQDAVAAAGHGSAGERAPRRRVRTYVALDCRLLLVGERRHHPCWTLTLLAWAIVSPIFILTCPVLCRSHCYFVSTHNSLSTGVEVWLRSTLRHPLRPLNLRLQRLPSHWAPLPSR